MHSNVEEEVDGSEVCMRSRYDSNVEEKVDVE
jgi:hypothetical protein